jgi:hypothetical protein
MSNGMDEIEDYLDPQVPVPEDIELVDVLPRGYLSVSQATTFLKCPQQWYLRYIEAKPTKPSARMFQGIQVHAAVELMMKTRFLEGKLPPLEDATDAFSTAFDKQRPLIEDWEDQPPESFKDVGVTCTKVFYNEAAPKMMPVYVEKPFRTVIKAADGKIHLPVLGRIDSIQVQALNEKEYQSIREELVDNFAQQKTAGVKEPVLPALRKPKRVHDLKVVTDKWSENDLDNDLQFALYAGVENTPDVQVDQVVKGRAKVARPRYEVLSGVISARTVNHTVKVMEGVAKSIAMGHFPMTDPGNWWCSEKWCSMWTHCRGSK